MAVLISPLLMIEISAEVNFCALIKPIKGMSRKDNFFIFTICDTKIANVFQTYNWAEALFGYFYKLNGLKPVPIEF